jgi:hypothetical protein
MCIHVHWDSVLFILSSSVVDVFDVDASPYPSFAFLRLLKNHLVVIQGDCHFVAGRQMHELPTVGTTQGKNL